MIVQSPCRDCKERILGCHDSCIKYQDYRAKNERLKELKRKGKAYNGYVTDAIDSMQHNKSTQKELRGKYSQK